MNEKIVIKPEFTISEMENALAFLYSRTHSRNIAYSLQFLRFCETLIKEKIDIKFSIDSIFAKAMTVIASSIIECLLFDYLKQKEITREKWIDTQDPTELPFFKDDLTKRARIVYQKKQNCPLDKHIFFGETIELSFKEGIIDETLKKSITEVKKARDLIHIRGGEELDMKKINSDFYYKTTRPTLLKLMEYLKLKRAKDLFES